MIFNPVQWIHDCSDPLTLASRADDKPAFAGLSSGNLLGYLVLGLSWDPKGTELEAHHPAFSCLGESGSPRLAVRFPSSSGPQSTVSQASRRNILWWGEGRKGEDIYSFRYSFIP